MNAGDQNQFIVPPPGITPQPAEAKPVEPEPLEAEDLITLPPGIIDSGTYRLPQPRPLKHDGPADAPVFFPAAPGSVPAVVEPDAEKAGAAASPSPAPDAVDDATRASVGRRSAPAWRLTLPTGEHLLIERNTLIGRDPAMNEQWADAQLLPVTDPGKSVSKTHAALELTAAGELQVHDLDSTNGVYLAYSDGDEIDVVPGTPSRIDGRAELVFGEYAVTVSRA